MCWGKTLPCHDWIIAIIAEGRGLLRRWVLPVLLAQRGNSRGQNLPWNQHTKEGHESNTSRAGSNCSFLLKRFVRLLKRSTARGVRAFSSTAVAGACSSNPGLQEGFFFFFFSPCRRGSAVGERTEKTHVQRKLLYCTSAGRRGKQPNQWGVGRLRSLSSPPNPTLSFLSVQNTNFKNLHSAMMSFSAPAGLSSDYSPSILSLANKQID